MSDIYHMIIDWITFVKPAMAVPATEPVLKEFVERALAGEETNNLVEDFIYGDRYAELREAFSHKNTPNFEVFTPIPCKRR